MGLFEMDLLEVALHRVLYVPLSIVEDLEVGGACRDSLRKGKVLAPHEGVP